MLCACRCACTIHACVFVYDTCVCVYRGMQRSYADLEARAKEQHSNDIHDMEKRLHEKYETLIQAKVRVGGSCIGGRNNEVVFAGSLSVLLLPRRSAGSCWLYASFASSPHAVP
jgi:hypothetical protein